MTNDHFGRISPARQIARYGALPFRDFLDPGYFATELSSALAQRVFGDTLLGELLLNTTFMATGALCVFLLARRLTASIPLGILASAFAQLSFARTYDYDKVLFYPLGVLVLWHYFDRPTVRRLMSVAVTIVVAGLFRYDNGVFLGVAAVVGLVLFHGATATTVRRVSGLIGGVLLFCVPFAAFIQANGGVADAVDQMLTYGVRESARTHLSQYPRIIPGRWLLIHEPPDLSRITIRWKPGFDEIGRADSARRLGLQGEVQENAAAEREGLARRSAERDGLARRSAEREGGMWSYEVADESAEHLKRITDDLAVDTVWGIDPRGYRLEHPIDLWTRVVRRVPLLRARVLPDFWSGDNAAGLLFYVLAGVPVLALAALLFTARRDPTTSATIASLVTLTILLDVFILRDPIGARIGGIAGPPAVLGAWLARHALRAGPLVALRRLALIAVAAIVLVALSIACSWPRLLFPVVTDPSRVLAVLHSVAAPTPDQLRLLAPRDEALVRYIRRCTLPTDRVFATWFFPELYWYAQRGFAGGVVALFGDHWSEARFQERMVHSFRTHAVPIVLVKTRAYLELHDVYPQFEAYLRANYRRGGSTNFGDASLDADEYSVFVRTDRWHGAVDPEWGLACTAG